MMLRWLSLPNQVPGYTAVSSFIELVIPATLVSAVLWLGLLATWLFTWLLA